ncbi:MAG: N-acetylmuramoyl-L-alanine amidase [Rhodomicrobium sp.]|nr:N-acetylmuramoyl-L-alanine amidase [Rhodomicrobium sp.]
MAVRHAAAKDVTLSAGIGGDIKHTRFVAFLSKKVEYRIFSITDPYRIVIDLPETEIQVPSGIHRGLVLSSRSGLLTQGRSRIVIDLAEPALIEKSVLLPPENGLPARLIIELTKATHKAFLAASKVPPPERPRGSAQIAAQEKNPADRRPLIVIDPGHGGVDAGAHGRETNLPEKEVTFDFCKTLSAKLEAAGKYRIVMTRTVDVFVPLDDRAQMAAGPKADLLISIHADALDAKRLGVKSLHEVRGGTIYTLSDEASDEQAKLIAGNENKADVQAGVGSEQQAPVISAEINSILSDLESRSKKNISLALANYLIGHLKNKMKFNIRPHRSANLRVLKAAGVPAVLIELGYLSNDDDEKLLASAEWRASIAAELAEAVNAFMSGRQARLPL